jgi:hypothetical protein
LLTQVSRIIRVRRLTQRYSGLSRFIDYAL